VYLILFSLNIFLQINVDDLGSVFVDLYTSLYIAFDDVLSEEIYQTYLFKKRMSQSFLQVLTLT
jgi:hypothetical protein